MISISDQEQQIEGRMQLFDQIVRVTSLLERLSPDSNWQRRSSGIRGALLRYAAVMFDDNFKENDIELINNLIKVGYELLEKAAMGLYNKRLL